MGVIICIRSDISTMTITTATETIYRTIDIWMVRNPFVYSTEFGGGGGFDFLLDFKIYL